MPLQKVKLDIWLIIFLLGSVHIKFGKWALSWAQWEYLYGEVMASS